MTEPLITMLTTNIVFSDSDFFFLVNNQFCFCDLNITKTCNFCESFFIKFIKLMKLIKIYNYYIIIDSYNIFLDSNYTLVLNTTYFFAI